MIRARAIRLALILLLTGGFLVGLAPRVSAHGGGDTSDKASDIVKQCIAFLVNEPDMDMIEDKMHDALDAPDMTGVDMDDVTAAHAAFHAGDMDRAQAYLEASIGLQPHMSGIQAAAVMQDVMPATGADPGNVVIDQPLDGVRSLSGGNLAAFVLSILAIVAGAALALRTRPRHRREV